MVSSRVVVFEVCGEVDLPRGEEEEDDDDELQHEDVGEADADGEAVGLRGFGSYWSRTAWRVG